MFSRITTRAFTNALEKYQLNSRRKLYDSGYSRHMLNSKDDFISISRNTREEINLADGSSSYSKGIGISTINDDAMYIPDLIRGLISTAQDDLAGRYTLFGNKKVIVTDKEPLLTGNVIRTGTLVESGEYLSNNDIVFRSVHYDDTKLHLFASFIF